MDMRDKYGKQHEKLNGRKREELAFNGRARDSRYTETLVAIDDAIDIANGTIPHTHMRLWALLQDPMVRIRGQNLHPRHCSRPGFVRFLNRPNAGRRIWTIQFYGNIGRIGTGDSFELVRLEAPAVREVMRPFGSVRKMAFGNTFVPPRAVIARHKSALSGRCMSLLFGSTGNSAIISLYEASLNSCRWANRIWQTMERLHQGAMALP